MKFVICKSLKLMCMLLYFKVVLNITYEAGQVYVNDLPVNSGVTRISCQTLIGEYTKLFPIVLFIITLN